MDYCCAEFFLVQPAESSVGDTNNKLGTNDSLDKEKLIDHLILSKVFPAKCSTGGQITFGQNLL